ncbi:MAG TPA: AraC family transcriptional regulator ligand-binding domain-containing protein [Pseudomonadales bacterium]|nr:AraC family transcriptional regulator ligand-binding domain-containing protein [Pseudomonadales bacterium]
MPHPRFYVTSNLAGLLLRYLDQTGLSAPDCRQRLASLPTQSRMPMQLWWELLERIHQNQPQPALGFRIGACIRAEDSGVLAYLIMHCNNLGEALLRFQRYQSLLHNYSDAHLEFIGDQIKISWDVDQGISTQLSDEVFLSGLITFIQQITNTKIQPSELHFVHAAPCTQQEYERAVGCKVKFNAERVGILFGSALLATPINSHNPYLLSLFEKQAEALIDPHAKKDTFLDALRQQLTQLLASGTPTLTSLAKQLHLSTRTLHRRLEDRGMNFNYLLRQTRYRLAQHYLTDTELSLVEIAFLLGYSEQSAFTRAFSQWAGCAPQQFRKQRA